MDLTYDKDVIIREIGGPGERAPGSLNCDKGEILPIEIAPLTFILGA
jgi:hypothetical protein